MAIKSPLLLSSDPKSVATRPTKLPELLGQVFTPQSVAKKMGELLFESRPNTPLKILDPAVGPGTFPLALWEEDLLNATDKISAFDIDPLMVASTQKATQSLNIPLTVLKRDYALSFLREKFDGIILNPPYVRQEWLTRKSAYQSFFLKHYGIRIPGTSNLYVYFLAKALTELKPNGKLVGIVYDSWQFTRFGEWLNGLIAANCSNFEVINVGQQPFHGHMIDATIIVATRSSKEFTSVPVDNGSRNKRIGPFDAIPQYKSLDSLFKTKRGLRLKQSNFFLCDFSACKKIGATPFIKKVNTITGFTIPAKHKEATLLVTPDNPKPAVMEELYNRLALAKKCPESNISILTWHRERPATWHIHRLPTHEPLIFNYYLRNRPRHLLNPSRAYSDNFYGLTPKGNIDLYAALAILNSTSVCLDILIKSRNQGSGLKKIQLFEFRTVRVPDYTTLTAPARERLSQLGRTLSKTHKDKAVEVILEIDKEIAKYFKNPILQPVRLKTLWNRTFSTDCYERAL